MGCQYEMIDISRKTCYATNGKLKECLYYMKINCKITIEKLIHCRAYLNKLFFIDKER